MFGSKTWCMKKPFGYRVAHHGYLLTSCPGLYVHYYNKNLETKRSVTSKRINK